MTSKFYINILRNNIYYYPLKIIAAFIAINYIYFLSYIYVIY